MQRDDYWMLDCETAPIDNVDAFLEPLTPPANYKKEDVIAEWLNDAKAAQLDKSSLDPHLARIVCLGHRVAGEDIVSVCRTEDEEAVVLRAFWFAFEAHPRPVRLVTFNGFRFDLPMVMIRSDYLGVAHPVLNVDRYRSHHFDLAQHLTFNDTMPRHSLRFHARRWGITIHDADIDGSHIAKLAADGEWDKIAAHCKSDLALTEQLAIKYHVLPAPSVVAA